MTSEQQQSVLREARLGLQLSLRDVSAFMTDMEASAPELYTGWHRTTINEYEIGKKDWRNADAKAFRALITLLFGSPSGFAAVAADPHLSPAEQGTQPASEDEIYTALSTKMDSARTNVRSIAETTKQLVACNPNAYRTMSKSTVASALSDARSGWQAANTVRTLIAALYGSIEEFVAETGLDPHLSSCQPTPHKVPCWPLDAEVEPQELIHGEGTLIISEPATYVLLSNSDMTALMPEGTPLRVLPTTRAKRGRLHAVYRRGVVRAAWAFTPDTFGTLDGRRFTLAGDDSVIGLIVNEGTEAPLGKAMVLSRSA